MNEALSHPAEAILYGAGDDTWPAIRKFLRCETESAVSGFSVTLSAFDADAPMEGKMLVSLEDYARVVESKAKEEAGRVLIRMKGRYHLIFFWVKLNFIAKTKPKAAKSLKQKIPQQ